MLSTQTPKALIASALADGLFPFSEMWWLHPAHLKAQFESVEPGTVIVYGVGQLDYAHEIAHGPERKDIQATREYAYFLWKAGDALLTQKKLGPGKYEYLLTKMKLHTPKPEDF